MQYIVTDSLGNIMQYFFDRDAALCYKDTFGNKKWKIKTIFK